MKTLYCGHCCSNKLLKQEMRKQKGQFKIIEASNTRGGCWKCKRLDTPECAPCKLAFQRYQNYLQMVKDRQTRTLPLLVIDDGRHVYGHNDILKELRDQSVAVAPKDTRGKESHYAVLGAPVDASLATVRFKFKRLIVANKDKPEKLKEIKEAYDILEKFLR